MYRKPDTPKVKQSRHDVNNLCHALDGFLTRKRALTETVTADATGMGRRAYGEFVGPGGEPASYTFGWTTGADPHVARLSVGIGAGNPGGGTFHAVIFANEGGHAFSLTDQPFERVPQGGPDLTADQARAHEDLPFVWRLRRGRRHRPDRAPAPRRRRGAQPDRRPGSAAGP
jgi:hypothetical protein